MERFLGLSEEEILENSMLWKEERDVEDPLQGSEDGLKGVGASPGPSGGDFDDSDFDADDLDDEITDDSVISGDENAEPETDENV
jgi:hypothetical protein